MCFPNKRENACMFPIKPPKKLGNAHMFCIPRGPMVGNAHVLFLCFFVFPKNDKIQSFILRRAQADWQQSGPANLSKRKRKKKNAAHCVEDRGNASMVVQKWRNHRLLAVTCTFCPCRMQKICFTQKITQKMNRCKFGKRTPVKSYESYNLSYKLD